VPWTLTSRLLANAPPHTFVPLIGSHNRAFRLSAANYHQRLQAFIGERASGPARAARTPRSASPRPVAPEVTRMKPTLIAPPAPVGADNPQRPAHGARPAPLRRATRRRLPA